MTDAVNVSDLRVTVGGRILVDGVSFAVAPGECVAIVGESGAGKSVTARALLGLLPTRARADSERLEVGGVDASRLAEPEWRRLRGRSIALVSQDALAALDPLQRIGSEVAEPVRLHEPQVRGAALRARVRDQLERVWMP